MNPAEIQQIDSLVSWLRGYFVVCAAVYIIIAVAGGWYACANRSRWLWIIPSTTLVYIVGVVFHWQFTNDDSFIFYRYAEHIAAGLGPAYNPGVLCEGFTSPAWTYMLAGVTALDASPLSFSKVIGTACGVLSIVLIVLAVRRVNEDPRIVFITSFFVTTSQLIITWMPSGMDTALFLAWLSAWSFHLVGKTRHSVGTILLIAVGVWIRPEAYFIATIGVTWILYSSGRRAFARSSIALVGLAVLAFALPFIWRYLMFGEFLPTTFYAKSDRTLRNGLGFVFGAINGYGALTWVVALAGMWALRRASTWVGITALAISGYVIWVGGDVLIQRFSLWWMPFVAIGLAAGLRDIATTKLLDPRFVVPLIGLALGSQELHRMYCATRPMSEHDGYLYVAANSVHTTEADASIGRYLRDHGMPHDTVITDNIGAIGYYSGMVVVDVNGLVDPQIARLIHQNRKSDIAGLIADLNARWIVGYEVSGSTRIQLPNVGELSARVLSKYESLGVWVSRTGYTRVLLRRSDT